MDHYRTLQVSRDAEPEVIEKAYRALCLKYHPDRMPPAGRERATRHMQRINEAYGVLRDPDARAAYDRRLPVDGESGAAWERFLDQGLVGLFDDWLRAKGSRWTL